MFVLEFAGEGAKARDEGVVARVMGHGDTGAVGRVEVAGPVVVLSMRHPNEYYTGGAEPDGVWWNPAGLFGLETGNTISTKDFYRLYEGYSPIPKTSSRGTRARRTAPPASTSPSAPTRASPHSGPLRDLSSART